jgi:hypothetical protein
VGPREEEEEEEEDCDINHHMAVAKVTDCQQVHKNLRILMWRDLISIS